MDNSAHSSQKTRSAGTAAVEDLVKFRDTLAGFFGDP
jgi:hypothetical protein